MLSGREQAATIVEAVRLGAADYVVKPDDPEGLGEIALDAAIKNAIEKTRLVSRDHRAAPAAERRSGAARSSSGATAPRCRRSRSIIEQVADSDVTVLIRGESGVGKELVARAIHQRSSRKDRPFVKVNCAALPAELLESELFGHEKGAFTGAATTRIGKFEQADSGTIFLDEIGEMKAALQAKLLHVLQDAQFTKLGSNKPINVDVRVVAATNRDLEAMMMQRRVPRGPLLPPQGHRGHGAAAARTARARSRTSPTSSSTATLARYNRPVRQLSDELAQLLPDLRVAGQHPRAREHDQADRDPAGRAAGRPRDDARAAVRKSPTRSAGVGAQRAGLVAVARGRAPEAPRRDGRGRRRMLAGRAAGSRRPADRGSPTSRRRRRSRPSGR